MYVFDHVFSEKPKNPKALLVHKRQKRSVGRCLRACLEVYVADPAIHGCFDFRELEIEQGGVECLFCAVYVGEGFEVVDLASDQIFLADGSFVLFVDALEVDGSISKRRSPLRTN